MNDADKLRKLAVWFDYEQARREEWSGDDVQKDLREMAEKLDKFGGNIPEVKQMTDRQKEITVGPFKYFTFDGVTYHLSNNKQLTITPAKCVCSGLERDFVNLAKEILKDEIYGLETEAWVWRNKWISAVRQLNPDL